MKRITLTVRDGERLSEFTVLVSDYELSMERSDATIGALKLLAEALPKMFEETER